MLFLFNNFLMFCKFDCSKVKIEMFIFIDNFCFDLNLFLYLGLILVKLILFCILKLCRNNLFFNVNVRDKILNFIYILFVFMFKKMNNICMKFNILFFIFILKSKLFLYGFKI